MRLYLDATNDKNITFTPDWLKVYYTENEESHCLTLDIRGEIDYSEGLLSCRVKGELIPWTLENLDTGEIMEFDECESIEKIYDIFPERKIIDVMSIGNWFEIGVWFAPPSEEKFMTIVMENGVGNFSMIDKKGNLYEREFHFSQMLSSE